MKILVCGAGIAGLTLAWWLSLDGHEVEVVEKRNRLRGGGYMTEFFGSGWDVAERMGLLRRLARIHHPVSRLDFVRDDGRTKTSLSYPVLRKRLFRNRHFNFMKADLERVLLEALEDSVDVRFGTSVESLQNGPSSVDVTLTDGTRDSYDLLVGADGIHSPIRQMVFGENAVTLRPTGFHAGAFVIRDAALSKENAGRFRTLTVPGRRVAIYPIRGRKIAAIFIHDTRLQPVDSGGPAALLRSVYGDLGWSIPKLLGQMPAEIHFDTVCETAVDGWSRGRVVLVGDACHAVSLLAGQGASLAMAGAWALSTELQRGAPVDRALHLYECRWRHVIEKRQRTARRIAKWLVPGSTSRIALRDLVLRLSVKPGMSWLVRGTIGGSSIVD